MPSLLDNPDVRATIEADYLRAIARMAEAETKATILLATAIGVSERGDELTAEVVDEMRTAAEELRQAAAEVAEVLGVTIASRALPLVEASPLGRPQRDRVLASMLTPARDVARRNGSTAADR